MTALQGRILRLLITFPAYLAVMILLHEAGHAVTAARSTDAKIQIHVWPGYELYPAFGNRFREKWPQGSPAVTTLSPASPTLLARDAYGSYAVTFAEDEMRQMQPYLPLIALMGTAATTLSAFIALSLISLFKPKGLMLWCLAAGSLLHLDMLTYAVLPTFLGVRHLYFIGGETAEPVEALSGFGLPESLSIAAIILLSVMQCLWLYYLLTFKLRRPVP